MNVDFRRLHPLIYYQSVNFVKDENSFDLCLPCLSHHSLCLRTNSLNYIDQDESPIRKSDCRANLYGEVNMPWRINDVNKILLLLWLVCFWLRHLFVTMYDRDRWCFHRDLPLLLIFARVKVPQSTCKFLGNNVVWANQTVGKSCFSMINMGKDAYISYFLRN